MSVIHEPVSCRIVAGCFISIGKLAAGSLGNRKPFRPDETSKARPIKSKTKTPPHPASETTSNSPLKRMKKKPERRSVLSLGPDGGHGPEPREKGGTGEPHLGPSRAIATRHAVGEFLILESEMIDPFPWIGRSRCGLRLAYGVRRRKKRSR